MFRRTTGGGSGGLLDGGMVSRASNGLNPPGKGPVASRRTRTLKAAVVAVLVVSAFLALQLVRYLTPSSPSSSSSPLPGGGSSPRNTRPGPFALCSHKLAVLPSIPVPLTSSDFTAALKAAIDNGLGCADVDITRAEIAVAPGPGQRKESRIVVGHPGDIQTAIAAAAAAGAAAGATGAAKSALITKTAVDVFEALRTVTAARISYPNRGGAGGSGDNANNKRRSASTGSATTRSICLTMELKGDVGEDEQFVRRLGQAINAPRARGPSGEAPCLAVNDPIVTLPPPPSSRAAGAVPPPPSSPADRVSAILHSITPPIPLALPMRDDVGARRTGSPPSDAVPCHVGERDDPNDFAKKAESYAVLMPSSGCLRRPHVQRAVQAWKDLRKRTGGGGADVRVWTIDDCEEAREMLRLGATHVVSNRATELAMTCDGMQEGQTGA